MKLDKKSTRFCIGVKCGFLNTVTPKVSLVRIGAPCVNAPTSCAPSLFSGCPPAPTEVSVQVGVELSLVEVREDGSICALITDELKNLALGRYTATLVGVSGKPNCFQVELVDTLPEISTSVESPDVCEPCQDVVSCSTGSTTTTTTLWER
jgi:hypothetical protein